LQRQTCRDFRVILSDDSPDAEISALLRGGHFDAVTRGLEIELVRGPGHARLNFTSLIDLWAGRTPFVHLQLDDDVIFPDFYREHLDAHAGGRYSVSASRRWIANADGRPLHGFDLPACITASPLRRVPVDAQALFQSMVPACSNWVGEFSNMVLSAEGARHWPRPPASGLSYYSWMDVGFLLSAVRHAPMVYLPDHLSLFRSHPRQTTQQMNNHGGRVSSMGWVTCALQAWREQRITAAQAVNAIMVTVRQCLDRHGEGDPVIDEFYDTIQAHGASLDALAAAFEPFWLRVLASHRATAPARPLAACAAPVAAESTAAESTAA